MPLIKALLNPKAQEDSIWQELQLAMKIQMEKGECTIYKLKKVNAVECMEEINAILEKSKK